MDERPEDFGMELRRRRMAAGLSLASLAERTHYSRSHIAKVETGQRTACADFVRLCDAALNAGGRWASQTVRGDARRAGADLPEGGETVTTWVVGMEPGGAGWATAADGREPGAAAPLPAAWFPAPAAAPSDSVVETFRSLLSLLRGLGQRSAPGTMVPMLIGHAHALRGLAAVAPQPARAEYLVLAGRFAELAGWMAQEAGEDAVALVLTADAVRLAAAGGDCELAAYAHVRQALVTLYRDDALQTIALARQALEHPGASRRIRGLAAIREAQGHALAGDHDECLRSLDLARSLLDEPRPRSANEPLLGTSTVLDPVAMATGWCLHDLGRPSQAAAILDRELEHVVHTAHRSATRYGVRRALAYASAGEPEHACLLAAAALPAMAALDSATIRTDVRRLAATLSRWNTHPAVRELLPELSAALRTRPLQTN